MENNNKCHCGNNEPFEKCCRRYIIGNINPPTALALMKSRYSAFVIKNIDYLVKTAHPSLNAKKSSLLEWANQVTWKKLRIISSTAGTGNHTAGEVEFKAYYKQGLKNDIQHEKSLFTKENNTWYYTKGVINPTPLASAETNRNDLCPCGSGKKFKKCCL